MTELLYFPSNSGHYGFRALAQRGDVADEAICVSLHYRASNRHI